MKSSIKAALIAAALSSPAVAGPDDTTKALMNEYVSLLDWGIHRLEDFIPDSEGAFISVNYDWDANTILVERTEYLKISREDAEESCKDWVALSRGMAGINSETGKVYEGVNNTRWSMLFGHAGYRNGSQEDHSKKLADLDKKFQLKGSYRLEDGGTLTCTTPLVGKGVQMGVE